MSSSGPFKLKIQTTNRAEDSRKICQKDSSTTKTINQVQQAVEISQIKSFLDSIQTKTKANRSNLTISRNRSNRVSLDSIQTKTKKLLVDEVAKK